MNRKPHVRLLLNTLIVLLCLGCSPGIKQTGADASKDTVTASISNDTEQEIVSEGITSTEDEVKTEPQYEPTHPEHTIFQRFLDGEITVSEPNYTEKEDEDFYEQPKRLSIGDMEALGVKSYYICDLNGDATDEMLFYYDQTIVHCFAADLENDALIWIKSIFYSGCDEVRLCSDNTIVMVDKGHPGREVYLVGAYDGGDTLIEVLSLKHEYNDPMYQVEKESWRMVKSGIETELTEDEYNEMVKDIEKKMIEIEWQSFSVNDMKQGTIERVNAFTLPESLSSFLTNLMFADDAVYDYRDYGKHEETSTLMYDIFNMFSCIDYSLYPIEGKDVFYCFDEAYMESIVVPDGVEIATVEQDPLGFFVGENAWVNLHGYYKYKAESIDWVLKNVFNCPDEEIQRMRKGVLGKEEEFPYYYHDGYYYSAEGHGYGWVLSYEVDILDAIKRGNRYSLIYRENIYFEGNEYEESTRIMYGEVEWKETDGIQYWSLYIRKPDERRVFLETVTQTQAASEENVESAERIIQSVGLRGAITIEEYLHDSEDTDKLVLLTYDEDKEIMVYDCIPSSKSGESVHTYAIVSNNRHVIYVNGGFYPDRSDFKIWHSKCGSIIISYYRLLGVGTAQQEVIIIPYTFIYDSDIDFFRIPADELAKIIQEDLILEYRKADDGVSVISKASDVTKTLGEFSVEKSEKLKGQMFDQLILGDSVMKYSNKKNLQISMCFYPNTSVDIDGIYAGEITIPLYLTENVNYDLNTAAVHIGCISSVQIY